MNPHLYKEILTLSKSALCACASRCNSRSQKVCATDSSFNDAVIANLRHDAHMTSRRGALTLHDKHRPLVATNEDSLTAAEEATQ
jgi:hypothetical protein